MYQQTVEEIEALIKPYVDTDFLVTAVHILTGITQHCSLPTGLSEFSNFTETDFADISQKDGQAVEVVFSFQLTQLCVEVFLGQHITSLGLNSSDNKERPNEFHQSTASILSFIQMNLLAIRACSLCISDLPARILCRSVAEAADLLIAIQADDGLARKWIDSQDDPRTFWHENLSGKRLSKSRNKLMESLFQNRQDELRKIATHLKNESNMFSMAAHPSYQAGFMAIAELLGDVEWYPRRTLRHSSFRVSLALQVALIKCANRTIHVEHGSKVEPDKVLKSIKAVLKGAVFCSLVGVPESDYAQIKDHVLSLP